LHPVWFPAVLLAALVPTFAALGVWQLHRADDKRAVQQEYDARAAEPRLRLGPRLQSADELSFRRVVARGRYDPDYQILLDNRVHNHVVGYEVLTPLRLEGGDTRVLVDRGWVALGESRAQLPPIETPTDVREISGVAKVPSGCGFMCRFVFGTPPTNTPGWQPVWPRLDVTRYAATVPFAVQPVVVLLDADAAHGYVREWTRLDDGIVVHQAYAAQWFALAVLAVVIVTVFLRRHASRRSRR